MDSRPESVNKLRTFLESKPDFPFYALIGHPVGHSHSPLIHNHALKKAGSSARYIALDTTGDDVAWLGQLLSHPHFLGANVTIPHKQRIIDLLDRTEPKATSVGAVNTVKPENGVLTGYNTDIRGAEASIKEYALRIMGRPAVIFGTGGAARAYAAAVQVAGINQVYVISRNPEISRWPDRFGKTSVKISGYLNLPDLLSGAGLIINTTPLGMSPNLDESPVSENLAPLLKEKVCLDAIYNPLKTKFLKLAEKAGASATISGLTMFVEQAAASYYIWTGKPFPKEEAKELIINASKNDIPR